MYLRMKKIKSVGDNLKKLNVVDLFQLTITLQIF